MTNSCSETHIGARFWNFVSGEMTLHDVTMAVEFFRIPYKYATRYLLVLRYWLFDCCFQPVLAADFKGFHSLNC